jgi:hypothetical protein
MVKTKQPQSKPWSLRFRPYCFPRSDIPSIWMYLKYVFAHSACNSGIIRNGPKSTQCTTVLWTKGEKKKMQTVSKRSFCENGGNNSPMFVVSRFVGPTQMWTKPDRKHALWTCVNLIVCYHSDNKQVDADSRWCEVWWYLCTILEDPHHASNWAVSCWYFDYINIDSFSTFTSSQHISELERKIGRKYSGRLSYAKILCRIKWCKL